jgi:tetratricopeptide (TPR) repeat protein
MSSSSTDDFNAAIDALQAGRFEQALESVQSVLMADATDAEAWRLLILILNALGRDGEAAAAVEKLRALGLPEYDEHLLEAAKAQAAGDWAAAISQYRAALAADPTRPEIHAGLAMALIESGQPDEARAAALSAVEIEPGNGGAHYVLGRVLRLSGDKEQALAALDKAVALDPDNFMALYEQGMLLAEAGRTAEALANFEKVLAARPGDPGATQAVATLRAALAPITR